MPLRDHFRPPTSLRSSWEGLHGGWPMTMVQRLAVVLPDNFTAEPRVHLGSYYEMDVSTYEDDEPKQFDWKSADNAGGVATATWAPPAPTLSIDGDFREEYEYAVHVYDQSRGRTLVAAVEIVSPANKDRPESRGAFVTKCAALMQRGVCVSVVDLVTTRHFNLFSELLSLLEPNRSAWEAEPPATYAATSRTRKADHIFRRDIWAYTLEVDKPLPALPIWLTEDTAVALDLEGSYEDACRALRIG